MITSFLRRNPGSTLELITDHLWSCIPVESRRKFDSGVAHTLEQLSEFGIVECRDGWRLSCDPDPFANLVRNAKGESHIIDAFGSWSVSYSGTREPRVTTAMASFVADDNRTDDARRLAYVDFLMVIGVDADRWPRPEVLLSLPVPTGFDWSILNAYLPRRSRRSMPLARGHRSVCCWVGFIRGPM